MCSYWSQKQTLEMKFIFSILLFKTELVFGTIITGQMYSVPSYERNFRLNYTTSTTKYTSSLIGCIKDCVADSSCNSVNVRKDDKVLCELSNEYALGNYGDLTADNNYRYFEKKQKDECKNGGTWNLTTQSCDNCQFLTFGKHCHQFVTDCKYAYDNFSEKRRSETYIALIRPLQSVKSFFVKCLLAWGGVTYVAKRWHDVEPSENFNRGWTDFKMGFGSFDLEYFIGLENLHLLTRQRVYRLNVFIISKSKQTGEAMYHDFNIENEANNFTLSYGSYAPSSSMEDGLGFGSVNTIVNHSPFCTYDRECNACSQTSNSGWWFNTECSEINLHAPHGGSQYIVWPFNGSKDDITYYDFQLI